MGVLQAEELARAITASSSLAAIYSGPLERARATADAIARCQRVTTRVCDELDEIDFGSWTGKTFDALADDPAWHTFNRTRATSIIPGGESPVDVQQRIVAAVARLAAQHRGHTIALVSHCDVVRSALLQYLSLSLDRYHEIEIAPASVSAIEMRADGSVRVAFVNRAADALAQ